jgi:hypothetical protein
MEAPVVRDREGCAVCGAPTPKRSVSPVEEVSATYCDECQTVVQALESLAGAGPITDQSVFHLAALRRLRRTEEVVHQLVRRRIQAALVRGGAWDDITDAVGMPEDKIKATYPLWDTPEKNWGWG